MTETAASSCALPKDYVATKVGSAGKQLMHSEIRIVREDGSTADPDELGEIWMRGPTITPGYWNRPEANQESFVDGWFRSGDIGCRDTDGFIYIEDRIKDMYISGGENVYPAEVENALYAHEAVADVAVIGVPHEKWGEAVKACVVVKEGESLDEAGLIAQKRRIRQHLPQAALPAVIRVHNRREVEPEIDTGHISARAQDHPTDIIHRIPDRRRAARRREEQGCRVEIGAGAAKKCRGTRRSLSRQRVQDCRPLRQRQALCRRRGSRSESPQRGRGRGALARRQT